MTALLTYANGDVEMMYVPDEVLRVGYVQMADLMPGARLRMRTFQLRELIQESPTSPLHGRRFAIFDEVVIEKGREV